MEMLDRMADLRHPPGLIHHHPSWSFYYKVGQSTIKSMIRSTTSQRGSSPRRRQRSHLRNPDDSRSASGGWIISERITTLRRPERLVRTLPRTWRRVCGAAATAEGAAGGRGAVVLEVAARGATAAPSDTERDNRVGAGCCGKIVAAARTVRPGPAGPATVRSGSTRRIAVNSAGGRTGAVG